MVTARKIQVAGTRVDSRDDSVSTSRISMSDRGYMQVMSMLAEYCLML
jgi:hypothetical protein